MSDKFPTVELLQNIVLHYFSVFLIHQNYSLVLKNLTDIMWWIIRWWKGSVGGVEELDLLLSTQTSETGS